MGIFLDCNQKLSKRLKLLSLKRLEKIVSLVCVFSLRSRCHLLFRILNRMECERLWNNTAEGHRDDKNEGEKLYNFYEMRRWGQWNYATEFGPFYVLSNHLRDSNNSCAYNENISYVCYSWMMTNVVVICSREIAVLFL